MTATLMTGLTITWETGFMAEIVDFTHDGMSRAMIDSSHAGTTNWRTFIAGGLTDPGGLSVTLNFIPGTTPPHNNAFSAVTVTYPDAGAATWAGSAAMSDFSITGGLEDKLQATATLKLSGAITVTP